MKIGCVKEIKSFENRVGLIPSQVKTLCSLGVEVLIEEGAGNNANITDHMYRESGAKLIKKAQEIWQLADLLIKVKEPLEAEYQFFKKGQALFTFLHLAAEERLTQALLDASVTSIAFETITQNGTLPILKPMSEVAGRMAVQVGAHCLEKQNGGKGILLSGVPGVRRGRVCILGAGVVGKNAAKMAIGLGAETVMIDVSQKKLEEMDDLFFGKVKTLFSSEHSIRRELMRADLVIGAVLITGAKAPRLVDRAMIKAMEPGSVVVDVSVDQGGCIETVHRTTHDHPIYSEEGVIHYGVANMPGAVSSTSTLALAHALTPYLEKMARLGVFGALKEDAGLLAGLNTFDGLCTHQGVAKSLGLSYQDPSQIVGFSK